MKKNILLFVILTFIFLLSCNEKVTTEFYENGNKFKKYHKKDGKYEGIYEEYYPDGNLKVKKVFENGVERDSIIYYNNNSSSSIMKIEYLSVIDSVKQKYFHENGNLKKEGFVNLNRNAIGKWVFYNDKKEISAVREYKNISGKEYLNQEWALNPRGDTLYYQSNFFNFYSSSDTIYLNEPFKGIVRVDCPLFKDKESEIYILLPHIIGNLNSDFSNEHRIKLDTFYSLKKDIKNQKWFSNEQAKYPYIAAFGKKSLKKGKNIIRGIILESYFDKNKSVDIMHRKYFEKEIFVKDSIGSVPNLKENQT
ncbi:hypothetical protein [Wocania ichthyoenteri]|uniref:hypothetical protein n=1 Tax=Wocania ichthyoenteri TaxID=1230531 RepID=UPI00053E1169|nr:hypothetical protein [Wocania ichthyoenteri]